LTRALLIDGGQSGCRVAVARNGVIGAVETVPGLRRVGRAYDSLRALVSRNEVDLVAAGLTGYTGEPLDLGIPAILTNDAVTAYLGALGDAPGAVIVAGTGAIALASGTECARADGWGTLLGDAGGGYWIARRALELALRAADGRDGSPELLALAHARYGPDVVHAIYDAPDPTATIAAFTRDLAAAPDAVPIWEQAGRELAHTALAALARAGAPPTVSFAGGLFGAGELILGPLRAALGFDVREPLGDGLAGAARLAAGTDRFASLVHGVAP
jgi:N-acetylglucosamine kinase-like BadF-type ATPase